MARLPLRGPVKAPNRPVEPSSARARAQVAWAEQRLSGRRLEVFRAWAERDREARSRGYRLVRLQHTADPWDMATSDEAAENVYWYQVPVDTSDERHWRGLEAAMADPHTTREMAERLGANAKQLPSATPERLERLRKAFRDRFGGTRIPDSAKGTK